MGCIISLAHCASSRVMITQSEQTGVVLTVFWVIYRTNRSRQKYLIYYWNFRFCNSGAQRWTARTHVRLNLETCCVSAWVGIQCGHPQMILPNEMLVTRQQAWAKWAHWLCAAYVVKDEIKFCWNTTGGSLSPKSLTCFSTQEQRIEALCVSTYLWVGSWVGKLFEQLIIRNHKELINELHNKDWRR